MKYGWHKLLIIISTTLLLVVYHGAGVSSVSCGQTITRNTTLQANVVCPAGASNGIVFGASNITLDLAGYSIIGPPASNDNYSRGISATEQNGITIKNGTITGFDEAIFLSMSKQVTITNMQFIKPRVGGVGGQLGTEYLIEDSFFDLPIADIPRVETTGISNNRGLMRIHNVEIRNGSTGVGFGFAKVADCAKGPSNGEVLNSTFTGVYLSSILIYCSTDVRIADNNISASTEGAAVDAIAPYPGTITGLLVEKNTVRDNPSGIVFSGATDSVVRENTVLDSKWYGMLMMESEGCVTPEPHTGWEECFYTTRNSIHNNKVLRSGLADLRHHPLATGNTWLNNTCITWDGAEIKGCLGVGLPWLPLLLN